MAAQSGGDSTSLAEWLYEKPRNFDFLQVIRILRAADPSGRTQLLGDSPDDEFVNFSSDISLAFPTSDVVSVKPPREGSTVPDVLV